MHAPHSGVGGLERHAPGLETIESLRSLHSVPSRQEALVSGDRDGPWMQSDRGLSRAASKAAGGAVDAAPAKAAGAADGGGGGSSMCVIL